MIYVFIMVRTMKSSIALGPCDVASSPHIDVVVTWVNVSDPDWGVGALKAVRNTTCSGPCSLLMLTPPCIAFSWQGCGQDYIDVSTSDSGDVDPFDALRFSLRSIRQHLPFVRKIFLVTPDQKPDWLQETEFLEIVPHCSFTQGNRTLFDGTVVEANIGRVDQASECFLHIRKPHTSLDQSTTQCNARRTHSAIDHVVCLVPAADDDFIINRPMSRDDYFPQGWLRVPAYVFVVLPKIFHKVTNFIDMPLGVFWGDRSKLELIDPHTPYPIHKGIFQEFCSKSLLNQGRAVELIPPGKETCASIQSGECTAPNYSLGRWIRYLVLESNYGDWKTWNLMPGPGLPIGVPAIPPWLNFWLLDWYRPAHAWIPSHKPAITTPFWVNSITSWLHRRFPEPAPWEKSW